MRRGWGQVGCGLVCIQELGGREWVTAFERSGQSLVQLGLDEVVEATTLLEAAGTPASSLGPSCCPAGAVRDLMGVMIARHWRDLRSCDVSGNRDLFMTFVRCSVGDTSIRRHMHT